MLVVHIVIIDDLKQAAAINTDSCIYTSGAHTFFSAKGHKQNSQNPRATQL